MKFCEYGPRMKNYKRVNFKRSVAVESWRSVNHFFHSEEHFSYMMITLSRIQKEGDKREERNLENETFGKRGGRPTNGKENSKWE
jgi:hypothetical protein